MNIIIKPDFIVKKENELSAGAVEYTDCFSAEV